MHAAATLNTALRILMNHACSHKQGILSIADSFDAARQGLQANCAAFFIVEHATRSVRLRTVRSRGFSSRQLSAAECGEEVDQTGLAAVWREALDGLSVAPTRSVAAPHVGNGASAALEQRIICHAIRDAVIDRVCGVLYFERTGNGAPAFDDAERMWAVDYATVAGYAFACSTHEENRDSAVSPGECACDDNAPQLVGDSLQTQALRSELRDIYIPACGTRDPEPILVLGEKGTGKDLVARYIYARSQRQTQPFIAVNCAEITDELAAARFFGHKKGAFTGSVASEPGLFRAADRGVLLLDEIGQLSLRAQATLLRVLENRTVVPVGETKETRVDVQVILATNCDLPSAIAQGIVRSDFYDRFGTVAIRLPPLRERPLDIPALSRHFIAYHEARAQKETLGFDLDALRAMVRYSWPGNVRELARVCSLLVTRARAGALIDTALLDKCVPYLRTGCCNPLAELVLMKDAPMRKAVKAFEHDLIYNRLRLHNWDIPSARHSLRLPKTTFHRYLHKLGISDSRPVPASS